ncbi:MAG: uroporphyrinogen decarboxylase family protein [Christensenellales bacterium]|jgi:uroporphyrinogen-III decarboxylase
MNKRERVLAALHNQPVDCVPAGFWYHFEGEAATGEACVQAHLQYFRDSDLDFIKIMCDGYFPYPLSEELRTPADWYRLQPLTPGHPFIAEQVWRAKRIVEEISNECCVFYNVFAPFSSIRFGAGEERVMADLRVDPAAVQYALDVIARSNGLLAEKLITEAGCDGVYYCVQGGEADRFSAETYRQLIAPSDLKVLQHANRFSQNNILHCCGWAGAKNRLSLWKDYPAACVNWAVFVEEVSLTQGRKLFGGKACLGGFQTLHQPDGSNLGLIHTGTKEEIQAFTREIIDNYGKTGLLLGGDCTINPGIDVSHLRWVVEEARKG